MTENQDKILSLSEASQITGYHQDYLGQLCRSGKLRGQKIGRNWTTTQSAITELQAGLVGEPATQDILPSASSVVVHVVDPSGVIPEATSHRGLSGIHASGIPSAAVDWDDTVIANDIAQEQSYPQKFEELSSDNFDVNAAHFFAGLTESPITNPPSANHVSFVKERMQDLHLRNSVESLENKVAEIEAGAPTGNSEIQSQVAWIPNQVWDDTKVGDQNKLTNKFASNFDFGQDENVTATNSNNGISSTDVKKLFSSFENPKSQNKFAVATASAIAVVGLFASVVLAQPNLLSPFFGEDNNSYISYIPENGKTAGVIAVTDGSDSNPQGQVLGTTVVVHSAQQPVTEITESYIDRLILFNLEQLMNNGWVKGAKGDPGPAGPAGSSGGGGGSGPVYIQPYIPVSPTTSNPGGTLAAFTNLSSDTFNTRTAAVTQNLTVGGSATVTGNLNVTGTITGTVTGTIDPGFTEGSVVFQGASGLAEDNSGLFYDDTSNLLGVGTNAPAYLIDAQGSDPIISVESTSTNGDAVIRMESHRLGVGNEWTFGPGVGSSHQNFAFLTTTGAITAMSLSQTGQLSLGTESPSAKLHVLSTTEQLRLGYDTTNYTSLTTSSTGATTFSFNGSAPKAIFIPQVDSGSAFDFQDSAGDSLFRLDTSGRIVNVGENDGSGKFNVNATINSATSFIYGQNISVNADNSLFGNVNALNIELEGAFAGSTSTNGIRSFNTLNSTATQLFTNAVGNSGVAGVVSNTTVGHNAGLLGLSIGSSSLNSGVFGTATNSSNSAVRNIGVVGQALNATNNIGGYFYLGSTTPTGFTSAALLANNGSQSAPIFVAQDNGTEVFRIDDGGNVGIGSDTSPVAALTVGVDTTAGVANGAGDVYVQNDLEVDGTLTVAGATTYSGALSVITTTSPQLTVGYDSSNKFTTAVASDGGTTWAMLGTDADLNVDFSGATDGDFSINTDDLFVDTSTGNVGIGTAIPLAPLDVRGGDIYIQRNQYLTARDTSTGGTRGLIRWLSASDELQIGSTNSMIVNFGSDTDPFTKLWATTNDTGIEFDNDTQKSWRLANEGSGGAFATNGFIIRNMTDSVNALFMSNAGNVAMGNTSPTALLDVNNTTTTTITAAANARVLNLQGAFTEAGSGVHSRIVGLEITPPTITAGVATVTNTASLYISDAPTATVTGGNYSLWVDSGNSRFDGALQLNGGTFPATGEGMELLASNDTGYIQMYNRDTSSWGDLQINAEDLLFNTTGGYAVLTGAVVIGPGDLSPDASLEVINDASGDSFLVADSADGDTSPFVIQADGDVGIGIASPGAKLEVAAEQLFSYPTMGTAKGTLHISPVAATDDDTTAITFGANSAGTLINSGQAGIYVQSSNSYGTKMYFGTTGVYATGSQARMMIDQSGNIGIADITPDASLEVVNDGSGDSFLVADGGDGDTSPFVIQADGDVGVGTTGPVGKFSVQSGISAASMTLGSTTGISQSLNLDTTGWGMYFGLDTGTGNGWIQQGRTSASTAYNLLLQASGGNVGIGTTAPGVKLQVDTPTPGSDTYSIVSKDLTVNRQVGFYWKSGGLEGGVKADSQFNLTTGGSIFLNPGGSTTITASATATGIGGLNTPINSLDVFGGVAIGSYLSGYGGAATAPTDGLIVAGNVGIGTISPDAKLEIAGNMTQAAWGLNGIQLQGTAATYTDSSTAISGTATNAVFNSFGQPTLAATNTSVTTTNAATVYIANAPAAGTNQTITNAYALWVDAGTARFDGDVSVAGTLTGAGSGTFGYFSRSGTTITPATPSDSISFPVDGILSERFGAGAVATGHYGSAFGNSANAGSGANVAVGGSATATGANTVAVGQASSATGFVSTAVGSSANDTFGYGIALGYGATTTTTNQFIAGSNTAGINNVYFGNGVTNASPGGFVLQGTGGSGADVAGASVTIAGGKGTGAAAGGDILFQTSDAGVSSSTLQSLTTKMIITELGNIGIGTSSPYGKLNVSVAPTATPNYGLVSIGTGPWDGATAGYFVGDSFGTVLAINTPSFIGTNLRIQEAGVDILYLAGTTAGAATMNLGTGFDGPIINNMSSDGYGMTYKQTGLGIFSVGTTGASSTRVLYYDGANQWTLLAPTDNAAYTKVLTINAKTTLTTAGAKLLSLQNNGSENAYVDKDGGGYFAGSTGIGTTGADAKLEIAGNMTQAAWGFNGIQLQGTAATYTDSSTAESGTATNAVFTSFGQPTLAATNAITTTNAANVYIAAAPAAGTNQTITNAYALWVDDGVSRFDGDVRVGSPTGGDIVLDSYGRAYIDPGNVNFGVDTGLAVSARHPSTNSLTVQQMTAGVGSDQTYDLQVWNRLDGATMASMSVRGELRARTSRILAMDTHELTGDIDPAASTTVTGTNTAFGLELMVGDRITVSGETRTVTAIASATSLTVDAAFSDNANDTTPDRLPSEFSVLDSSGNIDLMVQDSGFVGIGDISADYKLEVTSAASSDSSFALSDGDVATGLTDIGETDAYALFRPISSTAGGLKLEALSDTDASALNMYGFIGSTDPTDTTAAVKIVGAKKNTTNIQDLAALETVFQVANNATNLFTILGGGKIGVGDVTSIASGNLPAGSVVIGNGALCVDNGGDNCDDAGRTAGTVYSVGTDVTGIDLAENYPSADTSLVPGELVMIDEANNEFIKRANKPYGKTLLGVVSTAPGVILGGFRGSNEFSATKQYPIALTGRVPVKVTNENGNILPGDYLTASTQFSGYAMKATRSGQIIGQALESFNSSTQSSSGSIVVFMQVGYQQINNTIVLDAPVLESDDQSSLQGPNQTGLAAAESSSTFIIKQESVSPQSGSANSLSDILQLQSGDANRLMVGSNGALTLNAEVLGQTQKLFVINNNGSELFSIKASGLAVLYGTLVVKQDLAVMGRILGTSAILAQNVSGTSLEIGDLVVLAGASSKNFGDIPVIAVMKSTASSPDAFVVGIVDRNMTAMINDQENTTDDSLPIGPDDYLSIVTTGSYKTLKVDSSGGVITTGDKLTLSATPGLARKWTVEDTLPVVGVALDSLATDTGTVRVFLMTKQSSNISSQSLGGSGGVSTSEPPPSGGAIDPLPESGPDQTPVDPPVVLEPELTPPPTQDPPPLSPITETIVTP